MPLQPHVLQLRDHFWYNPTYAGFSEISGFAGVSDADKARACVYARLENLLQQDIATANSRRCGGGLSFLVVLMDLPKKMWQTVSLYILYTVCTDAKQSLSWLFWPGYKGQSIPRMMRHIRIKLSHTGSIHKMRHASLHWQSLAIVVSLIDLRRKKRKVTKYHDF